LRDRGAHENEIGTEQFGGGGIWIPADFKRQALTLLPGKHTIRLAIFAMPPVAGGPMVVRAISNSVEIEKQSPPGKASTSQPKSTEDMPKPKRLQDFPTREKNKIIAYSPDGKLIAVANGDPSLIMQTNGTSKVMGKWHPWVEIFDAETGKAVLSLQFSNIDEDASLPGFKGISHYEIAALAFSPDGSVLAYGTSIGQVKLINPRTGESVRSLNDEKAKLAEKKTAEKLKPLKLAMGTVASLAFSPDGSLLAMCGASFDDSAQNWGGIRQLGELATGPGRLKVWDVKTGTLKHDLVGHRHADTVAFSPDGNLLASAGSWLSDRDHGTGVIIWNPQTGKKICTIRKEANGGTHAVAFSPNSKLVVIGSRIFDKDNDTSTTAVSVVHALTGIVEWQQSISGWANPMGFSSDGKSVAVLCGEQSIRLFDTETGKLKHEIRPLKGREWKNFAFAPKANVLAIAGIDAKTTGFVELWDLDGVGAERK
jgi:WD40 repeat protein